MTEQQDGIILAGFKSFLIPFKIKVGDFSCNGTHVNNSTYKLIILSFELKRNR